MQATVSDFVISLFNIVRLRIRCKKFFAKGFGNPAEEEEEIPKAIQTVPDVIQTDPDLKQKLP